MTDWKAIAVAMTYVSDCCGCNPYNFLDEEQEAALREAVNADGK